MIKNLWSIIACFIFFGLIFVNCSKENDVFPETDLESKYLIEYVDILESYRNGVLANRNGEKLRTQIMTFSFAEGNRAYFCTTSDKPLYEQLVAFPYVSYCTYPEDWEPVLSLNGKVVFTEDRELMERALESNYYAKLNFKNIENPLLKVFYIDVEYIETYGTEGVNIYTAK